MSGSFFKDNLLSFLPLEWDIQDLAHGDLAAFLQVVAISLDELKCFIDDFPTIWNLEPPDQGGADPKYYPYLAAMINYPLSDRDEFEDQRLQLVNAVEVYKQKGLLEAFTILFYSLGYSINLIPLWTRDYKEFQQYPGHFVPLLSNATVVGNALPTLPITNVNCYLMIAIDGGPNQLVTLAQGSSVPMATIASQIDAVIEPQGQCYLNEGVLTISSNSIGQGSSVSLVNVVSSAYMDLGLAVGVYSGVDANVPTTWPELLQNGGDWYPSPHFGIQVYSIKGYVTDPDEFAYIRSRIELIRPCHTVLDWIDYVKNIADIFDITEEDMMGSIEPQFYDSPWPLFPNRGAAYVYIRDGTVHDRSAVNQIFYQHFRNTRTTAALRNEYVYQNIQLSREYPSGPPQMLDRGATPTSQGGGPYYFRDGYNQGSPTRQGSIYITDTLTLWSFPPDDPTDLTVFELDGLGDGT